MAKTTKTSKTTTKKAATETKTVGQSKATEKSSVEKKTEAKSVKATKVAPKKAATKEATPKVTKNTPLAHGVGRRKSSVARAWLRRGTGAFLVNGKKFTAYFDTENNRIEAYRPFEAIPAAQDYDVDVNVYGGGVNSQAGAVKLGISRALLQANEGFRAVLRKNGLLTVDDRVKERKKPGQPGARAKFQFVKR